MEDKVLLDVQGLKTYFHTFKGVVKAVDNVSFSLKEGEILGIVGESGSGKSVTSFSILKLVEDPGVVDADHIMFDGKDLAKISERDMSKIRGKDISMVFQDVYLFNDTIENNIRFGKQDATHEEVVEAAKAACCHDFIMSLPEGYDTVLGEGGGTLSGGEKQRISIARAMLKDAPIIILDEATASVDPENEAELQKAIDVLIHNKTIIMIAHRLKTVRNADQILVLNGGKITQRGTHEELSAQSGLYADFIHAREEAASWKLA